MASVELHLTVNGKALSLACEPCQTLLELLRDNLGLTGTKEGCGQGDCGACVVVMNGLAVNACLVFAAQAQGAEILTVEGLAQGDKLHPLQKEFAERWAFQCGFCTPGMLMSCYALLLHNPQPSEGEVRVAIEGNLCRCTSYQGVVEAVLAAAKQVSSP
jgi:carbon-monoxide dehydrogenase small subunit